MNEIRCPECGKVFSVDEASYASIVNQVRTKELEEEIRRRVVEVEKRQQLKQQADQLLMKNKFQDELNAKDQVIEKRNADIARLEEQAKNAEITKQAEYDKNLANAVALCKPYNITLRPLFRGLFMCNVVHKKSRTAFTGVRDNMLLYNRNTVQQEWDNTYIHDTILVSPGFCVSVNYYDFAEEIA